MRRDKWKVSDHEIKEVFEGTYFGSDHREVLRSAVLDTLAGWHIGHTAKCCATDLGLISKSGVTAKGKGFLWLELSTAHGEKRKIVNG